MRSTKKTKTEIGKEEPIRCGVKDENGLYCGRQISRFEYINQFNEKEEYKDAHKVITRREYKKLAKGKPWKYYVNLGFRKISLSLLIGLGMTLLTIAVGLAIGYIAFTASGYAVEKLMKDGWVGIGVAVGLVTAVIAFVYWSNYSLKWSSRLKPEERKNMENHDYSKEIVSLHEREYPPRHYEYGQNVYDHNDEIKEKKKIFYIGLGISCGIIAMCGGWLTYFLFNFSSFTNLHRALLLLMWYAPIALITGLIHSILWMRYYRLHDWSEIEIFACPTCHTLHTFVYVGKGDLTYGTYDKVVDSHASGEYKAYSFREADGYESASIYAWRQGYDTHEAGESYTKNYQYVCGKCGQRGKIAYTSHYAKKTYNTYNGR